MTIFQAARNPPKAETFYFVLDPTLSNVTVYITGDSVFTIYSPTGKTNTFTYRMLSYWISLYVLNQFHSVENDTPPKMKIRPFSCPHAIPDIYEFLSDKHKQTKKL